MSLGPRHCSMIQMQVDGNITDHRSTINVPTRTGFLRLSPTFCLCVSFHLSLSLVLCPSLFSVSLSPPLTPSHPHTHLSCQGYHKYRFYPPHLPTTTPPPPQPYPPHTSHPPFGPPHHSPPHSPFHRPGAFPGAGCVSWTGARGKRPSGPKCWTQVPRPAAPAHQGQLSLYCTSGARRSSRSAEEGAEKGGWQGRKRGRRVRCGEIQQIG